MPGQCPDVPCSGAAVNDAIPNDYKENEQKAFKQKDHSWGEQVY